MIEEFNSYVLQESSFKLLSKVLYQDIVSTDFDKYLVNDFNKLPSAYYVNTPFKTYFFNEKDKIPIKDFLSNTNVKETLDYITTEDKLVINTRKHLFEKSNTIFQDKLFLNKYNYSVSFTNIINELKLPKHFLLKALTSGCPDDQYEHAEQYNKELQVFLDKSKISIDDLKTSIIESYSEKVDSKFLKINYKLLDLVYLCITNNFELLTHTSLKLKIKDQDVFENVLGLLLDLKVEKSITNDIFNNTSYSIISINSSYIYNLFKTSFDNFNFILNMSKLFTLHLYKRLKNHHSFIINNKINSYYIQEFLYRFNNLYAKAYDSSSVEYLFKIKNYQLINETIELPINDIGILESQFIEVS